MNHDKLKKLLLLTLSDNDAEAIAALRKVQSMIEDWHKWVKDVASDKSDVPPGIRPFRTRPQPEPTTTWADIFRNQQAAQAAREQKAAADRARQAREETWSATGRSFAEARNEDILRAFREGLSQAKGHTWFQGADFTNEDKENK
jgi:hypothetical protein